MNHFSGDDYAGLVAGMIAALNRKGIYGDHAVWVICAMISGGVEFS